MAGALGEGAVEGTAAAAGVEAAVVPGGIVGLGRSRSAWGDCIDSEGPWAAALRDWGLDAHRTEGEGDDRSH
jgi:hypothetical protein